MELKVSVSEAMALIKEVENVPVDGHGHTYHPGVYPREKDLSGGQCTGRATDRVEAARRILAVLSKLGQEWWRKPHILPGWKDSL